MSSCVRTSPPPGLREIGPADRPRGILWCAPKTSDSKECPMSRRVRAIPQGAPVVAGPAARSSAVEIDTYFDKVVKYIPADIVGAWVAVTGLVSSASGIDRQMVL